MRNFLVICFLINYTICWAQDSTEIKVHFLYGSVPAKQFKKEEPKLFGGKHGGHVTIEVNQKVYGFNPKGSYHYFPRKKNKHSAWHRESARRFYRDTSGHRYASFIIKVDSLSNYRLDSLLESNYLNNPFDYAAFGFRCASATWFALEEINLLKRHSKLWKTMVIFYPRRIRKRMYKMADKKGWQIIMHDGTERRKWERDYCGYGFESQFPAKK